MDRRTSLTRWKTKRTVETRKKKRKKKGMSKCVKALRIRLHTFCHVNWELCAPECDSLHLQTPSRQESAPHVRLLFWDKCANIYLIPLSAAEQQPHSQSSQCDCYRRGQIAEPRINRFPQIDSKYLLFFLLFLLTVNLGSAPPSLRWLPQISKRGIRRFLPRVKL